MTIEEKIGYYRDKVNDSLGKYMNGDGSIYDAARYSLLSGGKRIRPILALLSGKVFKVSEDSIMPFACALEMIHTYSLIHDDLPSMDNDTYRRGRLTNHKVYGEAMAILAGDALLNKAYEIMINEIVARVDDMSECLSVAKDIARGAGIEGMIAGQVMDLEMSFSEQLKDEKNQEKLCRMHTLKTGCLINASVMMGAHLGGARDVEKQALFNFSNKLGLAFQIKDDILDVTGSRESLGKSIGKDEKEHKLTYVSVYGLDKATAYLEEITKEAIVALDVFGDRSSDLVSMAKYLLERTY